MGTSQFRDAIAKLVSQENETSRAALEGIKAVIGVEAFKALLADARDYNSKVGERDAVKAAQEAQKETERKAWFENHGNVVLAEYPKFYRLETEILGKIEYLRQQLNINKLAMRDLLAEHKASVVNDNGTFTVKPRGVHSTSTTPRVNRVSGAKITLSTGETFDNLREIGEKYAIPSMESGRPVYKLSHIAKHLPDGVTVSQ